MWFMEKVIVWLINLMEVWWSLVFFNDGIWFVILVVVEFDLVVLVGGMEVIVFVMWLECFVVFLLELEDKCFVIVDDCKSGIVSDVVMCGWYVDSEYMKNCFVFVF